MTDSFNQNQIQSVIGYDFKDDTLLKTAFSHSSRGVYGEETNERLLFLGRRLFDVIVCDYIFSRSPYATEAKLEAQLEAYRSGKFCENYLKERNLDKYIRVSEISNALQSSQNVKCEVFFALIGAIYRDGGMPSLKGFLLPILRASDGESVHSSEQTRQRRDRNYSPDESESKKYQSNASVYQQGHSSAPKKREYKSIDDIPELKDNNSNVNEAEAVTEKPIVRKPFIRDALTPVRLPDSMRTKRDHYKNKSETPNILADGENYKSILQELIQKNIRTANVLLKYQTSFNNGLARSEVTLNGMVLAYAENENKRLSERMAAKNAYEALKNTSSEAYKAFSSLCQGGVDISEQKEDYISKLNQYYQRTEHTSSAPITYERRYSPEKKTFCVALLHNGKEITSAKGETLKDARQNAAKKALEVLGVI